MFSQNLASLDQLPHRLLILAHYLFKSLTKRMVLFKFRSKLGAIQASFKTHPNVNKELFSSENILGLKDPNRPFPTGQAGDAAGVGLLKWRMQSNDESLVPLTINCCPSVSGNETYVSIEYEASTMFELQNVVISVPLPALREAPNVMQIDGEWSGSLEFVVPPADTSVFFPVSVRFSATETFSDLKVRDDSKQDAKTLILHKPVRGFNPPRGFMENLKENVDEYKWFIFEHALILFIGGVFEVQFYSIILPGM
ncbi:hypothetical protein K1719_002722 [Acacia pycnantha]|nr:hypothetical protein K1719_002722 [Acacia pycnantha]